MTLARKSDWVFSISKIRTVKRAKFMATKTFIKTGVSLISVGFIAAAVAQPGSAPLLSGVVQSVDAGHRTVVVAGKSVNTMDAARVVSGQAVNVYGTYASDGTIVNAVLESASTYVANNSAGGGAAGIHQAGISVGGTEAEGISVGGDQAEGISVGGTEVEGISVGGTEVEGISVGGTEVEGISVGGIQAEGISVGGESSD
jgi:hypothetical protein